MAGKVPPDGAVVLLSGGMDSAAVMAHAIQEWSGKGIFAIGFDYGQRHKSELSHAQAVADYYGVPFNIIELPKIFTGGGSSLMGDKDIEIIGTYKELADRFGSQPTVVPNRNMNFIAQAVTWALTHKVGHVLIGAHAGDAANYHYPDCRPAFNGAMMAAIEIATEGEVELSAPFNLATKGDIVRLAHHMGAPLHLTQSCYNGKSPACGECATCHERIQAFKEAGFIDPIAYEKVPEWGLLRPW